MMRELSSNALNMECHGVRIRNVEYKHISLNCLFSVICPEMLLKKHVGTFSWTADWQLTGAKVAGTHKKLLPSAKASFSHRQDTCPASLAVATATSRLMADLNICEAEPTGARHTIGTAEKGATESTRQ